MRWMCGLRPVPLLAAAALVVGCSSAPKTAAPRVESAANRLAADFALQLQGVPYRYGGQSPIDGFDCSGLVQYVYARQGVQLPRSTLDMAQRLASVSPEERQPGDLLFFDLEGKQWSHVALYVGNDAFVHAPREGRPVMRASLAQPFWREHLTGVRRP